MATESRQFALEESQRQTHLLGDEIKAHGKTDEALQEAKKTADSANLAKSRYLIGISHELRSPLNTILGYTQLLEKDQRLLDEQQSKLTLIHRSGEHLNDLIEGMLDISRIEAGRIELHREQLPLKMLVEDLVQMFRMQAEAKDLTFDYDNQRYIPDIVIGDEKRLRQILINLLSNAIKYTQSGGVTFNVTYRNQVAKFIVSDTGVGIGKEDKDLVFQPFERIRKPGSPQVSGVGLGLTISKFFAEIMGGEITLQSQEGKGSSFQLSMMLASVSEPILRSETIRKIMSYEGSKKTIMVVDDDASHRGLISEILTPLNFVVLEATDAYSCLEDIELVKVDLFLLDISMPGMNGWQLVKFLRKREIKSPIIMVSADAFQSPENNPNNKDVNADKRLHDDYLTKPINDNLLLDKIANALNLKWNYEPEKILSDGKDKLINAKPNYTELFKGINKSDCHELVSMAEIGYIEGIEKILTRIDKTQGNQDLVKNIRRYVKSCQFSKIISLTEKGLNS